jgi:hypothetical protein
LVGLPVLSLWGLRQYGGLLVGGNMRVLVGQMMFGFCSGYFDESYGNKRVEAVGKDWVVVRDLQSKELHFASTEGNGSIEDLFEDKDFDPETEF